MPTPLLAAAQKTVVASLTADTAGWHPGWAFVVQLLVALGTLGLAGVTVALVVKTKGMVEVSKDAVVVSRNALEVGIRPLLADPRPHRQDDRDETILFGAPGRISPTVQRGSFFSNFIYDFNHEGVTPKGGSHFSVAFENIGQGPAAISAWRTEPEFPGDVYVSRKFVPVGEIVRVNVSVLRGNPETARFDNFQWATGWGDQEAIKIIVEYSDTAGGETLVSTATLQQYATQGPFVKSITVHRKSDGTQLALGRHVKRR